MIAYQIDDKTYFIEDEFYWKNIDKYSLNEFTQIIMSGNFMNADLNDSFNAEIVSRIENDKIEYNE